MIWHLLVLSLREKKKNEVHFFIVSHTFVFIVDESIYRSMLVLKAQKQRDPENLYGNKKRRCCKSDYVFIFYKYLTNYMF